MGSRPNRFDAKAVARLERLPLRARMIAQGALKGLHRAKWHGSSIEFAQHKEYTPGDDVRHIDWKTYGRSGRYYVKQFEQETQLLCYLVVDATGSMEFVGGATHAKLDYAAHLLASLAYVLSTQQDAIGLLAFSEKDVDVCVPARSRPRHVHDLYGVLAELCARGGRGESSPTAALERVADLAKRRRALIVLASDMLTNDNTIIDRLRQLKAQSHDVVLFHTLAPHEIDFPYKGLTLFRSLEGSAELMANPDAVRRRYLRNLAEFLTRTKRECLHHGVDYLLANTGATVEQTLREFLISRMRP